MSSSDTGRFTTAAAAQPSPVSRRRATLCSLSPATKAQNINTTGTARQTASPSTMAPISNQWPVGRSESFNPAQK